MEKSIETIWQKGFITEDELKAPRVFNLFERKSLMIIDKLISRMRMEFWALFPLFAINFVVNLMLGNDLIWSFIGVIPFVPWFIISYNQLQKIKHIPTETNCYEYLVEVQKEVRRILRFNLRGSVIATFLVAFPIFLYTYINQKGKTFGEMFGVDNLDVDGLWIFAIIPLAMLFSYVLFKIMLKITGGVLRKLDEIIEDLDALRE